MTVKKSTCVIIGISLAIFALILSYTYRPYIYKNSIFDFHLADTIGNIFAVPSALFFLCGMRKNNTKITYSIRIIVLGYIFYEFLSLIGLNGTFDIFDIIATIVSGAATYIVLKFLSVSEL